MTLRVIFSSRSLLRSTDFLEYRNAISEGLLTSQVSTPRNSILAAVVIIDLRLEKMKGMGSRLGADSTNYSITM